MFSFWSTGKGKPDEARLLREAKSGDIESLGVLLELHRDGVHRVLMSKYGHIDPDLIDDAIQESFLQVARQITTTEIRSTFRSYLIGVTVHRLIDMFRKNRTSQTTSTDEDSVGEIIDPDSTRHDENIELSIDLERAISKLSTYEQLILKLYYMDNKPLRIIGPLVGKSLFQVSRDLERTRKKLKGYLEE
jgi:RNA polymerase sigma factor (sigma-70 family)